ncbi:hypothetical protein EYF80_054347 [Liparis tanakae]|uniref:Uncharacterized protein n=1 Tax=Liparis tanakae TaxID=230148 RepID=A0A4Z2F359_9TELE|nr:hypothetical protein EYF80_054347 [Liparis tanakae]
MKPRPLWRREVTSQSGDSSEYTRSFLPGRLKCACAAANPVPYRLTATCTAPSYLLRRWSPARRKSATASQQVRTLHEPLTPWHLHSRAMFMSAWASLPFLSLASTKPWLKRMACSTWSLQPPQSNEPVASRDEPVVFLGSQEHESSSPRLQARASV